MSASWRQRIAVTALGVAATICLSPLAAASATPSGSQAGLRRLVIRTVPAIADARIVLDGIPHRTMNDGTITLTISGAQRTALAADRDAHLQMSTQVVTLPDGGRARFLGWFEEGYHFSRVGDAVQVETAGFDVEYLTSFSFTDSHGAPVDPARVSSLQLRDSVGGATATAAGRSVWLLGRHVVNAAGDVSLRKIEYRLTSARVRGVNVVGDSNARFVPSANKHVRFKLRLFTVKFRARDVLFGSPIGSAIDIALQDGTTLHVSLNHGTATVLNMPNGPYEVRVHAQGIGRNQTLSVAGDGTADLQIIGLYDLAAGFAVFAFVVVALVALRHRLRRPTRRPQQPGASASDFDESASISSPVREGAR